MTTTQTPDSGATSIGLADRPEVRQAIRKVMKHHKLTQHGDNVVEADVARAVVAAINAIAPAPQAATPLPGGQDERALFEHEALRLDIVDEEGLERRESDEYVDEPAQAAWAAWQAARALTQQAAPEAPTITLMEGAEQHSSAFDKACGKFYREHGRLPAPIEIFAIASPVAAPEAPASEQQADQAHLMVSTAAGADRLAVLVSVKRGDITTVVYSGYHSMSGDSFGVQHIPSDIIATPAATTASTEMTAEQARAALQAMPLEAVVGMVKGATTASAPQYENVTDHNGKIIGVRMTNADQMPSYEATTASASGEKCCVLGSEGMPLCSDVCTEHGHCTWRAPAPSREAGPI